MHHIGKVVTLSVLLGLVALALVGINLKRNFAGPKGETRLISGVNLADGGLSVNGVLFDVSKAKISVDGQPATAGDLAPGMVVALAATLDPSGKTGWGREIVVDRLLAGPVAANAQGAEGSGTLEVLGQTVRIDQETRFASHRPEIATIADIPAGSLVEIHGFSGGDGEMLATRVEVLDPAAEDVRIFLKGRVCDRTASSFRLGGIRVDYGSADLVGFPGGLVSEGQPVEVESTFGQSGDSLLAEKVVRRNAGLMALADWEGDAIEVEGPVTEVSSRKQFAIGGQLVCLTEDTAMNGVSHPAVGVPLRVEGFFRPDGLIEAWEVRSGSGHTILLGATAGPPVDRRTSQAPNGPRT